MDSRGSYRWTDNLSKMFLRWIVVIENDNVSTDVYNAECCLWNNKITILTKRK